MFLDRFMTWDTVGPVSLRGSCEFCYVQSLSPLDNVICTRIWYAAKKLVESLVHVYKFNFMKAITFTQIINLFCSVLGPPCSDKFARSH
jgi:hypothetical protein